MTISERITLLREAPQIAARAKERGWISDPTTPPLTDKQCEAMRYQAKKEARRKQ